MPCHSFGRCLKDAFFVFVDLFPRFPALILEFPDPFITMFPQLSEGPLQFFHHLPVSGCFRKEFNHIINIKQSLCVDLSVQGITGSSSDLASEQ